MIALMFLDWLHRANQLPRLEMPEQMLSVERDFADPNPARSNASQFFYAQSQHHTSEAFVAE